MARDDLFRRSFEAGTAFLDMTRERAEALVKELVKAGDVRKGKAQKVIDEVLERSRKGSEELRHLIRREIAEQVGALGLATKADIDRLESRLESMGSTLAAPPAPGAPVAGSAAPGLADPPIGSSTAPLAAADPRPAPAPQPTKAPPVKRTGGSRKPAPPAATSAATATPTKAPAKSPRTAAPTVPAQPPLGGPPPDS